MRRSARALGPLTALLACACVTPQVALNPRADFSKIRRVAVMDFSGPQGDVAADVMTMSLLSHGAPVIERSQLDAIIKEQSLGASGALDPATVQQLGKVLGVDALFFGTVAESMPQQSYMVTQPRQSMVGSVTPVAAPEVYSQGPVLGVPDSQVVTTAASVSLVARMVDVTTGSILWSASMSYEGLDVPSAMGGITEAFVHSLMPIWPVLIAPKK